VFATTTVLLAGADLYHSLTKDDPDSIDIAVASAKTLAVVGDLVAPFVPVLRDYQPHIAFITALLKAVGTAKEILELTYEAEDVKSIAS
jgi:hypothetical protein